MSSQKISTFWQRLKNMFTASKQAETKDHKHSESNIPSSSANNTPHNALTSDLFTKEHAVLQRKRSTDASAHKSQRTTPVFSHKNASSSASPSAIDAPLKFTTSANVEQTDGMKQRGGASQRSNHPITDAVLEFLEANELTYHYHNADASQTPASATPNTSPTKNNSPTAQNSSRHYQSNSDYQRSSDQSSSDQSNGDYKREVHHISMAMRYYLEADTQSDIDEDKHNFDIDSNQRDIEWGCVIRIHEHTQLLAIYGILPFKLPESHINAGITLATQLNYDMMLGNVEIDIRDGEIRFKNALDVEPIVNASGGVIPSPVINFLLKSVMAMTTSFEPIFRELINTEAENFELQTLLAQMEEAQQKQTFFLVSETLQ